MEVNPLITTGDGDVMALDAKINIEDNALFRQPKLLEWRDPTQEDENENRAQAHGLNYVSLDGDIACMVNGAGLAMGTMATNKKRVEPANFRFISKARNKAPRNSRVTEKTTIIAVFRSAGMKLGSVKTNT